MKHRNCTSSGKWLTLGFSILQNKHSWDLKAFGNVYGSTVPLKKSQICLFIWFLKPAEVIVSDSTFSHYAMLITSVMFTSN